MFRLALFAALVSLLATAPSAAQQPIAFGDYRLNKPGTLQLVERASGQMNAILHNQAIVFDPSQLVVGRDSFSVMTQGSLLGALTRTIESSMHGDRPVFSVKSEIQVGALGGQSVEYVLDAASLDPITYEQAASQMGQTIQAQLTYDEGGRVTGSVSGAIEATIDTVFGTRVYDLDMLSTIVPTMALADGASFTLGIFQPPTQTFSQETLNVTDGGMVTVPAGEFDTWQVNMSGQLPWIFMVSKADPRRVVKMEIAPLSFELAGIL